jgi:hypothetical protein
VQAQSPRHATAPKAKGKGREDLGTGGS